MATLYYTTTCYLGFVIFGVGGLLYTIVSGLLYMVLPRSLGQRIGQRTLQRLFQFFLGYLRLARLAYVDFSAIDSLRGAGPMILAPNHPCLLDAMFIVSRMPRLICVMKAQITDNPFLGGGARLAGYIRNDSPGALVHGSVEQLRQGNQVLLFPEGTRTVRSPINELKGGFAIVATRAQVPVQTIIIETSSPFLGKEWPVGMVPEFPLRYRATLGERFIPGPEESARDFMQRVQKYLEGAVPGRAGQGRL